MEEKHYPSIRGLEVRKSGLGHSVVNAKMAVIIEKRYLHSQYTVSALSIHGICTLNTVTFLEHSVVNAKMAVIIEKRYLHSQYTVSALSIQ
jgi:hypothetical protein